MKRAMVVVVLALLCAAIWAQGEPVPQTANIAVTEVRVDQPFVIDWVKVNMLAGRIFAQPWLRICRGEWNEFYPSPARITTTYGMPAKGDSLTPVDDRSSRQRPCWVFWKDERSGVAVEKCVRGNWIVSTFVVDQMIQVPGPTTYVDRPVDRIVTVPQPYVVQVPVLISARQYIAPAGVSTIWTPMMPVATGATVVGPWRDIVTATLIWRPEPKVTCKPPPPPDDTCGPGNPNPAPPPDGAPATAPGNPTGQPNGGDSVPPGTGPPAPNVPDHGTHDHAGDINYTPSDPNIADRVK